MPTFNVSCTKCKFEDKISVSMWKAMGKMGAPHELIPDDEKTGPFRKMLASRHTGFAQYDRLYCWEAAKAGYHKATKDCQGVVVVKIDSIM
eukprot:g70.t1